jgi:hypothetical protein
VFLFLMFYFVFYHCAFLYYSCHHKGWGWMCNSGVELWLQL